MKKSIKRTIIAFMVIMALGIADVPIVSDAFNVTEDISATRRPVVTRTHWGNGNIKSQRRTTYHSNGKVKQVDLRQYNRNGRMFKRTITNRYTNGRVKQTDIRVIHANSQRVTKRTVVNRNTSGQITTRTVTDRNANNNRVTRILNQTRVRGQITTNATQRIRTYHSNGRIQRDIAYLHDGTRFTIRTDKNFNTSGVITHMWNRTSATVDLRTNYQNGVNHERLHFNKGATTWHRRDLWQNGAWVNQDTGGGNGNDNNKTYVVDTAYQITAETEAIRLINVERTKEGLNPLVLHVFSRNAARIRGQEMAISFSHTRPDGRHSRTALVDVGFSPLCDNGRILGPGGITGTTFSIEPFGSKTEMSPLMAGELAVNGWLFYSPPHRETLMMPQATHVGVGITPGGTYAFTGANLPTFPYHQSACTQ